MQIKYNNNLIKFRDNKITGIVGKNVEDIKCFFKSLSKKVYKISIFDIDSNNKLVKEVINKKKIDDELLKLLNLDMKLVDKNMIQLNMIEKIKVLVFDSIINKYEILYFDNLLPFLDSKSRIELTKMIIKLKKFCNKTIIISDINIDNIFEISDDIFIIIDKNNYVFDNKYEVFSNTNYNIDMPFTLVIKDKIYDKCKINIGNVDSINELIKAIYRELR